jgi:serine phosphatase RsbU (regulator of sigma subunit)
MKLAKPPKNEKQRMEALLKYEILDSEREQIYDDIVKLASQICEVPVSFMSLMDNHRQWYKAKLGITVTEDERELSMCNYTILQEDIFEVPDIQQDERFIDNPVLVSLGVRFYAGMPLTTPDGYNLGTLCVIDKQPKALNEHQKFALRTLSKQIMGQLELRLKLMEVDIQKAEIEEKNKSIIDSIRYARNIQRAILLDTEKFKEVLPESFIFLKPRDIVSGDFYYYGTVEGKIIVAAVDCTGHGVPGAFMCMLANEFLHQIIEENKVLDPAEILNQLRNKVHIALRQGETHNQDGMDIAICVIDKSQKILHYAGAKNSLYLFQNNILNEIKADRLMIGGVHTSQNRYFNTHQFSIEPPTTFYIGSDGIQDQFGGEDNKKMGRAVFRELLTHLNNLSIENQAIELENFISTWQGDYHQTDDMLLIGVRCCW